MKKNILSYPSHLDEVFKENIVFSVHSLFKNTVNLNYKDSLITLQHRSLMLTPMSISLDVSQTEFTHMFLENDTKVYIKDNSLYINHTSFDITNSNLVDFKFIVNSNIDPFMYILLYKKLKHYLLSINGRGELLNAYKVLNKDCTQKLSILSEYFYHKLSHLKKLKLNEYQSEWFDLIGAGEGLTPSGDDFLCGLLVSTYFMNSNEMIDFRNMLHENLVHQIDRTTDISRAYLKHACDGRYMEGLIRLYKTCEKKEDISKILDEISAIGHSSGTDLLVGLVFGLELGGIKE